MAFRGHSGVRGPRPRWLEAAADLRFIDHTGEDESVLVFEAPTLGEAVPELYQPRESWPTRPDPADTGLDLLGDVVRDVAAHNEDSDRFDRGLLGRLAGFVNVLGGGFREIRLGSNRRDAASPAIITAEVVRTAREFQEAIPPPQRVRVVGTLDIVRTSTQSFALRLDDGREVRGVLVSGSILDAAARLGRRVLVLGRAIYRPSGRLLRIDADEIAAAEGESSIWSRIPAARTRRFDLRRVIREQAHKTGMGAIMGQWPGDETDEAGRAGTQGHPLMNGGAGYLFDTQSVLAIMRLRAAFSRWRVRAARYGRRRVGSDRIGPAGCRRKRSGWPMAMWASTGTVQ